MIKNFVIQKIIRKFAIQNNVKKENENIHREATERIC